ncbi:MAG: helix-turn-helix domain-containing protein [Clostridia bacterium]|nr:helix-turn-helix domain-containing protein [Clostridia bacterium]
MKIYKFEKFIGDGRTIGIFCNQQSSDESLHSHDFIEVVYVLSGKATQRVDEACYEVERGDIIFINYGGKHSFEPHGAFKYVNICFMPETLGITVITQDNALALLSLTAFDDMRKDKNGGKFSFSGQEREEIEFIINAMLNEFQSSLCFSEKVIESYLVALLTKILRKTVIDDTADIKTEWEKLCEYIEENLGEELTLSSLAEKSFYNPAYFSRKFKQCFGISVSKYIREKRIEYAMKLLRNTTLCVDEIIEKSGFSDRSVFYRQFSIFTGKTPNEYRQKVK